MDLKKWRIFSKLDPGFVADIKRVYLVGIDPQEVNRGEEEPPSKLSWGGSIVVMKNGDVYAIALNSENLVLLGPIECGNVPPLVPMKIDALCGLGIQDMSSEVNHVTALTTDGRIYQWGETYREPQFLSGVLEGKNVIQVDCGQCHTLALSQEGEVYSWGSNFYGQLGTGTDTPETNPVKISGLNGFDKKIVSVAYGGWTSFALDSEGNVWSWGDHEDRALGYASSSPQLFPRKVLVNNIQKIAAGQSHALALTSKGTIYSWGTHYKEENRRVSPKQMTEVPDVVDIAAIRGCRVSAFQTAEGNVYFWGFAYGHLIPKPVLTEFSSLAELFPSLDSPMILKSMEIELKKEPWVDKLRLAFDDNRTGDVIFDVQGKLIHAHSAVLSLRSSYFKLKLDSIDVKIARIYSGKATIKIPEFTYPVFRTFLLFLYIDRIEPPPCTAEDALELFVAARNFGEEDLRQRLEQLLEVFITENNACNIYSVAVQRNSKALHDLSVDFIVSNLNPVMKTENFFKMTGDMQKRLIKELVDEEVFVGLKRKRKD